MINNSVETGAARAIRPIDNDNASKRTLADSVRIDSTSNPGHEGSNASEAVTAQAGKCPGHSMVQQLLTNLF